MTKKTILVTGASGFVGTVLIQALKQRDYNILTLYHNHIISKSDLDLTSAMSNIDAVIHLAARVHVMHDSDPDPLNAFRQANVELTKNLVDTAIAAKVKRFVFISSLHVNGSISLLRPYNEADKPEPPSPYAVSKLEAEEYLSAVAKKSNIEVVIIRPPLVYGPKVKGNFLSLLKLVKYGLPLPVGLLNNKRSMIDVNNLVNFIICCIENPKSANETFLISDDNDISTKELFTKLIKLFGKYPLLLPIPPKILYILGDLLGKKEIVERLCAPLQVDITKAKTLLGWKPIQTLDQGLKETVEWYKKECL